MKPHPRIRKTIKWGGAAVTVLLVMMWIVSGWWNVTWTSPGFATYGLQAGRFVVLPPSSVPAHRYLPGWSMEPNVFEFSWNSMWYVSPNNSLYALPIWMVAMLTGCAVCIAVGFDLEARRRSLKGFCPHCDYDRTGLAAGAACPECGSVSLSTK